MMAVCIAITTRTRSMRVGGRRCRGIVEDLALLLSPGSEFIRSGILIWHRRIAVVCRNIATIIRRIRAEGMRRRGIAVINRVAMLLTAPRFEAIVAHACKCTLSGGEERNKLK